MKTALILGIGGQDGSYLAEVLLEKGYEVHGLYRHSSVNNLQRIEHIKDQITLHQGDVLDSSSVLAAIINSGATEIYNEADQDNVGWSHDIPGQTFDVTGSAVGNLLSMICCTPKRDKIGFFQPLSATMFGNSKSPQNEETRHDPKSPYACAKVFAYHLCRYYRETYGMFVSTAIFYNHDSPRRSENYLLSKICRSAVRIARGKQEELLLGNLDLRVDIGYAKEYMEAAHSIMQLDKPDDFVIGSGSAYSIWELAKIAINRAGASEHRIKQNPDFTRVEKQTMLVGDNIKASNAFGYDPYYKGERLINLMITEIEREYK